MTNYFPKYFGQTCTLLGLSLWLPCVATAATTPAPVPALTWETDIQPIVESNCSVCHSGAQPSGEIHLETKEDVLKLKATIIQVVSQGVMPEGDPDFGTSADGKKFLDWLKSQVTFSADIQPIIAKNCSSCHNPTKSSGGLSFDTEAKVVAARAKISAAVSSGKMPKNNRTFKDTPEAKVLLDWIKSLDK